MNNEELKKKIAQIIADYFCPQKNEHKNLWGDDRLCYSKTNFAECERVAECTDALIAAGLRFGENLTATFDHIALEREHELERRLAEAKHRAEVAEKAFDLINKENPSCFVPYSCHGLDCIECAKKYFYEQAEKELEEERKDA